MSHRCPSCDTCLETEHGMRIHHTRVHGESLPNCTCNICGKEFYHPKSDRSRCPEHRGQSGELNGNYSDKLSTGVCEICGSEFEYYESNKKGLYCSDCQSDSPWASKEQSNQQQDTEDDECSNTKKHNPRVKTRTDGYEMIDTQYKHERVAIPHHRLLAIAVYGKGEVEDMDIHHINRIPWDNRPDNIEPVSRSDHARLHLD